MAGNALAASVVSDGQSEVIAYLEAPATHGGATVERIDTHIAVVCPVDDRADKLKRAVHYDDVDFSPLERRRIACEAEVRVNRRSCPGL